MNFANPLIYNDCKMYRYCCNSMLASRNVNILNGFNSDYLLVAFKFNYVCSLNFYEKYLNFYLLN